MWLDIGGGEPFLRSDLPEICSLFKAEVLSIPTNGWDTDSIVSGIHDIRTVFTGRLILSVSLDGPEAMHDSIRAPNSWKRAVRTIKLVRTIPDVSVKINTVICNENLDAIPAFLPWVHTLGVDAHSLILLRGEPRDNTLTTPSPDAIRALLPAIHTQLNTYSYDTNWLARRVLSAYHRLLWDVTIRTLESKTQVVPCLGGANHIVIWADKSAGSCEMLEPVGSLDEHRLSELMKSGEWAAQRRFIREKQCWCTHNCALLASLPFHMTWLARIVTKMPIR
jgi:MoaA/NifB/PqqE/SkfB family radical SAM enzyme